MAAAVEMAPRVGTKAACWAMKVARATFYRRLRRLPSEAPKAPRKATISSSPLALSEAERAATLKALHSERFVDKAPRQIHAELLDEGTYLCSQRTMYRILLGEKELRERRNQVEKFNEIDPAAFTYGSSIYFAPGAYDLTTYSGMGLIGHEMTHVEQFRSIGPIELPFLYWREYESNRSKTHSNGQPYTDFEAYEAVSFERAAREKEAFILEDLKKRYPNDPSCGCNSGGKN